MSATNPYWNEFVSLGMNGPRAASIETNAIRRRFVCLYALAVTSPSALEAITVFTQSEGMVEMGAGTGYWKKCLEGQGVSVVAFGRVNDRRGGIRFGECLFPAAFA
jgi:hypothetical protein